jgi:hypothetical protein
VVCRFSVLIFCLLIFCVDFLFVCPSAGRPLGIFRAFQSNLEIQDGFPVGAASLFRIGRSSQGPRGERFDERTARLRETRPARPQDTTSFSPSSPPAPPRFSDRQRRRTTCRNADVGSSGPSPGRWLRSKVACASPYGWASQLLLSRLSPSEKTQAWRRHGSRRQNKQTHLYARLHTPPPHAV